MVKLEGINVILKLDPAERVPKFIGYVPILSPATLPKAPVKTGIGAVV